MKPYGQKHAPHTCVCCHFESKSKKVTNNKKRERQKAKQEARKEARDCYKKS